MLLTAGAFSAGAAIPLGAQQEPHTAGTAATDTAAAAAALAFKGVTVVDVRDGRLLRDQTVLVVGRHIRRVGPVHDVRVPAGAKLVDARTKYLIPGLWDMHVHQGCRWDVTQPLLIANGITGVREAYTWYLDSFLTLRRAIAAGRRVGPRQVVAGSAIIASPWNIESCLDPNGPHIPMQLGLGSASTARIRAQQVVDSLKAAGADFIKIRLSGQNSAEENWSADSVAHERERYFAVAAAARRARIPLEGHLPLNVVTPEQASDSGQRIIDHYVGEGICIPALPRKTSSAPETVTLDRCQRLAKHLRRHGTWLMPNRGACPAPGDTVAAAWGVPLDTAELFADFRQWLNDPGSWQLVQHAGLPLVAGTDLFRVSGCFGAVLHTALAAYQWLGLTPLQALQTATLNPALVYHATDSLGTVEPGKVADLVLLDANPLADVYNTRTIRAVVANGRYFDRAALDSLRAEARRAYNASPR